MALLKPSNNTEYSKAKIDIKKTVLDDIFEYCKFAGISVDENSSDISEFVEKCMIEMINVKDKEWRKYKKEKQKSTL